MSKHILVVDDSVSISQMVEMTLKGAGYTVTTANNGKEAFKIFCDSADNFDMVITDKGMPEMDGIELTQNLLKVRPDLPVLLLSGYGDLINDDKIRKVGFRDILTKPVNFYEMSHALRHIFDGIS